MAKLRTMIINADKSGVDSTGDNDKRITKIGKYIRKYKLDEIMQLYNVLLGHISLVGPRPNVEREVKLYTKEERRILSVKPGITDFSSIVFSDEGRILKNENDPDIAYNQLIRPWKSRLAIFYIDNQNFYLDLILISLTFLALFDKEKSLFYMQKILKKLKASSDLIKVSSRKEKLVPKPPLGSDRIVLTRN